MTPLNEWEQQVRENNAVSHENVVLTLKEAQVFMEENEGEFDQALVIFYKRQDTGKIKSYWLNAGLHFSEAIFLFQYLSADFLRKMQDPDNE